MDRPAHSGLAPALEDVDQKDEEAEAEDEGTDRLDLIQRSNPSPVG